MSQPKLWKTLAIAGVAGVVGAVGIQSNAQAGSFIDQGYSVFAAPDPSNPPNDPLNVEPNPPVGDPPGEQCPLCDSTVSFAVYRPDTSDWAAELSAEWGIPILPTNQDGSVDLDAPYVFLYQVYNTDPLPQAESGISFFDVAVEEKTGKTGTAWVGPSPYSSAGWIPDTVFANASTDIFDNPLGQPTTPNGERQEQPCIDGDNGCPGNWIPDVLGSNFLPIIEDPNAVEPVQVLYTTVVDDEVERQNPPSSPTNGYTWTWLTPGGTIPTLGTSSLLFLTAETEQDFNNKLVQAGLVPDYCLEDASQDGCAWTKVNYPWGRTQSGDPIVGEGSSGDVAGLKVTFDKQKAPEPGTILGLLAVSGLGVAAKGKKQK
ncbi:hypothetical protein cce_3161 [Crocosphaera subtropica ATCC 51142]|uniref:PEP-CTERM protein-sorting domain-containing protein n=1 Tax=Crocosphaera subtropica (strain ATCC 51142 / BH68) TaxID=43989 RepID=B1WXG8_CROS5|nr:PEP-CTERM sorting domain-containing protein [Crocosphaera subtropica]ACB52509.1 hypothetical protein cce_3161 [Crocosphaera subtropica ATCC 51142]